ncbi:unnamed protein product [Candida verbasci]|uniref:Lysophospholipase n=1 Tax=Candida verbasci TaxID=1227364 RepID=A0A9W4TXJ5_9ASCO|nr:unnamed protein product [Candida verbasci]
MIYFVYFIFLIQFVYANYAPFEVSCPSGNLTRPADLGLNLQEIEYIQSRRPIVNESLSNYLKSANMSDFDVDWFLSNTNPTIGLAYSGGGFRSMLVSSGQFAALDIRTETENPVLSGILQSSDYIAGLSGGSWMVGSISSNDFISVDEIIAQNTLWVINSILDYYDNIIKTIEMWFDIGEQVESKQNAGFEISITDIWGRALSYTLLADFYQMGVNYTFSDIRNNSNFQNYSMPFPILVANGQKPNTTIVNVNSTVFEITPFEIGSFDPTLENFVDTKFVGTELDNGLPTNDYCINGFDNAGFFMGTSSSLFNGVILEVEDSKLPTFLKNFINDTFNKPGSLTAKYNPNPFYKSIDPQNEIEESETLYLVDGGEDGQNVPLIPLLHRNLSVIFAFDNSADTQLNWPNGTSLIETYERQFSSQGVPFPYVPDSYTFINLNLTSKPTFFGCDANNLSSLTNDIYDVPLVVYIANRPFTYWSNTSTFKLEYSNEERNSMIQNGYNVATRLNGTLDDEFQACIGCAIIRREQEKMGLPQSKQCRECFETYCWNGEIYIGESLGGNFSDDGITEDASDYNSENVKGINDGESEIFKKTK